MAECTAEKRPRPDRAWSPCLGPSDALSVRDTAQGHPYNSEPLAEVQVGSRWENRLVQP